MLHQSIAGISLATILLCVSHTPEYGWIMQACWINYLGNLDSKVKYGHRLDAFGDSHLHTIKTAFESVSNVSSVLGLGPSWTPPGSPFTANSAELVWKSGQKLSCVSPLTLWTHPVDPRADPGYAWWILSTEHQSGEWRKDGLGFPDGTDALVT